MWGHRDVVMFYVPPLAVRREPGRPCCGRVPFCRLQRAGWEAVRQERPSVPWGKPGQGPDWACQWAVRGRTRVHGRTGAEVANMGSQRPLAA